MNIDEMQAGRELDAMIAEKVMGVTIQEFGSDSFGGYCLKKENGDLYYFKGDCQIKFSIDEAKEIIPRYSTDILAAWEVVEKMKKNYGINIEIRDYAVSCEIQGEFKTFGASDVREHGSVPLVVCRAALKALGVNEI